MQIVYDEGVARPRFQFAFAGVESGSHRGADACLMISDNCLQAPIFNSRLQTSGPADIKGAESDMRKGRLQALFRSRRVERSAAKGLICDAASLCARVRKLQLDLDLDLSP